MPIGFQPFCPIQPPPLSAAGPAPAELAYWAANVTRQRYTTPTRPGSEKELFARIEHGGEWMYFPLGTQIPATAAVRAAKIYRETAKDGWNAVRQRHVRQIVWSIFWFTEPLACTYATLFTMPGKKRNLPPPAAAKRIPVAIIEPHSEVLPALQAAVNRMPDYACGQTAASATELLQNSVRRAAAPRLVLFNQQSLELATESFEQKLEAVWPGALAVPFAVFGHSDGLFMSVTGMDRGYFLQRRPPARLFEPLADFWSAPADRREPPRARVQRYFAKLLLAENQPPTLTHRERELIRHLGAGHTDKTIATLLGISVWTVHSHMKSMFEKLGVHTRAEAIMRYLQR